MARSWGTSRRTADCGNAAPGKSRPAAPEKAVELLDRVGLAGFDDSYPSTDPRGQYRESATGGAVAFALSIVAGVVTPIGEELAFRGVLTNALRRYGDLVSVLVSTLVFGLAHGVNLALIPAIVVGAIAAILFLRSDSVWPGVLVHAVDNTLGVTLAAVVDAAA